MKEWDIKVNALSQTIHMSYDKINFALKYFFDICSEVLNSGHDFKDINLILT